MNPSFSVVVACFNQGQYLDECLKSVLNQTYTNWECIIVNDGSTDSTENVAKLWTEKDDRFKLISKSNEGVSSSRNIGILNSNGDYILPLDADDKIGSEYLKIAKEEFIQNPTTKLIYGKAKKFGIDSGFWHLPKYSYHTLLVENSIYCSAIFKRSDFLNSNGYDISFKQGLEDWEFWISFLKPEDKVFFIENSVVFFYRIKHFSRNNSISNQNLKNLRWNIFQKHIEIYKDYFPDPIFNLQENKLLNQLYKNSLRYKIGNLILAPFSYFKNHFKL